MPMCRFFSELHKKLLVMPLSALAILAVSAGSLVFAFIAQHFFGVEACILCLYQRVPYGLAIVFALLALGFRSNNTYVKVFLGLCAVAFLVNAGIAFFHSGVELHWWVGTEDCAVNPLVLKDPEAARKMLLATPTVRCDAVNFTFLGFTMANWNILASLGLAAFSLLATLGPCVNWGKCCCCCKKA